MDIWAFFTFRRLLAPALIRLIYGLGFLVITFQTLALFAPTANGTAPPGVWGQAALLFVGGQIVWRIICEGFIVAFAVYERLGDILAELRRP